MSGVEHVIAIDLGGTKLAAAVVDSGGRVLARNKRASARGGVGESAKQIAEAAGVALPDSGVEEIRGVGVIVPGIYRAETGMAWAPNLWGHEEVPLRDELERRLEWPVVIESDRAGYVTGERWLGAARGLDDVVFLAVGTGIGAGIVSGGKLIGGSGGVAGAAGWFALNRERRDIYAQIGCWEAEAAGPALARRSGYASGELAIEAARAGNAEALRAIGETACYMGMGIANIVSLLNPQMVVLGGGLMQAADLFLEPIRRAMLEWAQPVAARQVRIEKTELGEDAGLLGAARLALDNI